MTLALFYVACNHQTCAVKITLIQSKIPRTSWGFTWALLPQLGCSRKTILRVLSTKAAPLFERPCRDLAAGLWKLVDERGVVVGACCCYVDDGLVVGDVEVIRRVTAFIQFRGLWAIKGQRILEKPGVGLSKDLVVSETLTLKLVECMRLLAAEISVASDGLQIGQAKYVAQELRARGRLALKGAESLYHQRVFRGLKSVTMPSKTM